MAEKLTFVLKGTTESPPVGNLKDYYTRLEEKENNPDSPKAPKSKKSQVAFTRIEVADEKEADDQEEERKTPVQKVDYYEEMGLTVEKTNFVQMITKTIGLSITKGKKGANTPKAAKSKKAGGARKR